MECKQCNRTVTALQNSKCYECLDPKDRDDIMHLAQYARVDRANLNSQKEIVKAVLSWRGATDFGCETTCMTCEFTNGFHDLMCEMKLLQTAAQDHADAIEYAAAPAEKA